LDQDFIQNPKNLMGCVESCRQQMAVAAVDLLVAQIKQNEFGVPQTQKSVVIEPNLVLSA
jgi:hypothetical protein